MTIFGVFRCQSNTTLARRVSRIALIDLFLTVGQSPFEGVNVLLVISRMENPYGNNARGLRSVWRLNTGCMKHMKRGPAFRP